MIAGPCSHQGPLVTGPAFSGAFLHLDIFLYLEIIVGKARSSLLNPSGDTFIGVEGSIFQNICMSPSSCHGLHKCLATCFLEERRFPVLHYPPFCTRRTINQLSCWQHGANNTKVMDLISIYVIQSWTRSSFQLRMFCDSDPCLC